MPKDLEGRVARLERDLHIGRSGRTMQQWRDEIAERFADPKYDADRDAIIEALCSPDPKQRTYCMVLPTMLNGYPATESHFISAGEGGPLVHVFIMPDKEDDPYMREDR